MTTRTPRNRKQQKVPDAQVLDDLVRRIVAALSPQEVLLFGSASRGDMGPHSDIDLLVVLQGPVDRMLARQRAYDATRPVDTAHDIVVATSADIERYGKSHALVYKPALAEGRVLYRAPQGTLPASDLRAEEEPPLMAGRFEPDDPREWLNRARSNLRKAGMEAEGVYLEDLLFDAQQAAEKAIKAVLILDNVAFPYVHTLETLLDLCAAQGRSLPVTLEEAKQLTPYAAALRYPDLTTGVTADGYVDLVGIAEALVLWAEDQVGYGPP